MSINHTLRVAAVLLCTGTAHAQQVIATCGESNGKSYYLEPTKDGWLDDGIKGGLTSFIRFPDGKLDILFKDFVGTRFASQDGAAVIKVFDSSEFITVVVIYAATNVVETYQLKLDRDGRGTLIWSNIKYRSGPMATTRGMLLVSNCSR
jgi:hypothetical protein